MKTNFKLILAMALIFLVFIFVSISQYNSISTILEKNHRYVDSEYVNLEIPLSSISHQQIKSSQNNYVKLNTSNNFGNDISSTLYYMSLYAEKDNMVLEMKLKHDANGNKFVVPSEIINVNGNYKYKESLQLEITNDKGESISARVEETKFGEYKVYINNDIVLKSLHLNLKLKDFKLLIVD